MNIFIHVIQEITAENSYVFCKLESLSNTLILEEDTLEDIQVEDNNFYTKFIFYINKPVQIYLSSCYFNKADKGLDIQHMNLSSLLQMIQDNHFSVEIPYILQKGLCKFCKKKRTLAQVRRYEKNLPSSVSDVAKEWSIQDHTPSFSYIKTKISVWSFNLT